MNPRKEIEFPWGETIIRSRPTMARVAEIERKFGAAPVLARRCANQELSISAEQLPMLAVMLRGCDEAPRTDAKVIEAAFDAGAANFINPMVFWLIAAYTVDTPVDQSEDPPAGN